MDSTLHPSVGEALKTADLETFRAMWTLGLLPTEHLPLAGVKALESGVDTESSRILAGLEKFDVREKAFELFRTIFNAFPPLSNDKAALIFARAVAAAILTGAVEPLVGARAIWLAASRVGESRDFHDLDGFIYAASEYADRPQMGDWLSTTIESEARRLIIRLANPDRVEYRIAREPAGDRYRSLIDAGLRHGETLLLVERPRIGLEKKGSELLARLKPHLIDVRQQSEWPGTLLFDHTATVHRFRFNFGSAQILKDETDRLYNWVQPELPEDPCILRRDGSPWLLTVTHEGFAGLDLDPTEYEELKQDAPVLIKSLRTDNPRQEES